MWSLSGPDLSVSVQPYLHRALFEINRNSIIQRERCMLPIVMRVTPAPACYRGTPRHVTPIDYSQLFLPSQFSI